MSTEETPDPIVKRTFTDPDTRIVSAIFYHEVPGSPPPPTPKRGFIAWATRANRRARRQWRDEYLAWVKAGKPKKTIATTVPVEWLRKDAK